MAKLFNDQGGLNKLKAHLELAKSKMPPDVREAHDHCSRHRAEILSSERCGCFYCLKTFDPAEIQDWVDDEQTALCAKCGIDAVIGSGSGFPITQKFLGEMHKYWF
jgi:hypothetical protein